MDKYKYQVNNSATLNFLVIYYGVNPWEGDHFLGKVFYQHFSWWLAVY